VNELAAAEIFALTPVILPDGDRDGIPNVLLEAMAAGLPVVASAVSGIPEVVADGLNGRLVPEGDIEAVAAVLAELISDGPQRDRLGAEGQRRVEGECGWQQAIVPLATLFRRVLAVPETNAAGELEAEVA
jgi:glycosyltransferase involved in cell wall biosynthesis